MTKTLVISDLHIPFHDEDAIEVVRELMRDIKFDKFIINGDLLDGWELSKFSKDPREHIAFTDEIDTAVELLSEFSSLTNCEKYFIVGNHDFRLEKYLVDQAQGLISLPQLSLNSLLNLDKLGYEEINMGKEGYMDVNGILVGHFNKVSMHSAYTAKALVERYGKSIVQGHIHRIGQHFKTTESETLQGVEGGCLCKLSPNYMMLPNWQQGCVIITSIGDKNWIEPIHIQDGEAIYQGVIYGAKKRI